MIQASRAWFSTCLSTPTSRDSQIGSLKTEIQWVQGDPVTWLEKKSRQYSVTNSQEGERTRDWSQRREHPNHTHTEALHQQHIWAFQMTKTLWMSYWYIWSISCPFLMFPNVKCLEKLEADLMKSQTPCFMACFEYTKSTITLTILPCWFLRVIRIYTKGTNRRQPCTRKLFWLRNFHINKLLQLEKN